MSHSERFPEMERALAKSVPSEADTVLAVGRSSRQVAEAVRDMLPGAQVKSSSAAAGVAPGMAKAVVLADPLPHDGRAERWLREARERAHEDGVVVAAFRRWAGLEDSPGSGMYSRVCVEVVLSRADLEPVAVSGIIAVSCGRKGGDFCGKAESDSAEATADAWVVCARPRKARLSSFGAARLERRRRADARNKQGEALFAKGEVIGAVEEFAAAINDWNEEAIYFNNLGAALHAINQPEQAWRRLREAVHLNPNLPVAWDNLRAVAEMLGRTKEGEELHQMFGPGWDR